jgi:hypothetical protein
MSDILYRAELRTQDQARELLRRESLPWIGAQLAQGRELAMEVRLLEDAITEAQRGYLHAVVLTEIAQFARANGGQQFPMAVWKEWYRSEFLGFKVVTSINPFTGKKVRRRVRISTEDLGVRGMIDYIDRVIAHASTELGVTVSEPLPPHLRPQRRRAQAVAEGDVDAETGEILEPTT